MRQASLPRISHNATGSAPAGKTFSQSAPFLFAILFLIPFLLHYLLRCFLFVKCEQAFSSPLSRVLWGGGGGGGRVVNDTWASIFPLSLIPSLSSELLHTSTYVYIFYVVCKVPWDERRCVQTASDHDRCTLQWFAWDGAPGVTLLLKPTHSGPEMKLRPGTPPLPLFSINSSFHQTEASLCRPVANLELHIWKCFPYSILPCGNPAFWSPRPKPLLFLLSNTALSQPKAPCSTKRMEMLSVNPWVLRESRVSESGAKRLEMLSVNPWVLRESRVSESGAHTPGNVVCKPWVLRESRVSESGAHTPGNVVCKPWVLRESRVL